MEKKLEIVYLDPHELIDYEYNNKDHTEHQVQQLADLIEEVGYDVPAVVDENKVIIKGHCRKYAAILKNKPSIPCIIRDDMTEEQKRLARIADNKLPENSSWIYENLRSEFDFLKEAGIDLKLTGFGENEILLISDANENFSFNDTDFGSDSKKDLEGAKDGRNYLCEIAFREKETAEMFLRNIGLEDWKFKGLTKLVDGNKISVKE